MIRARWMPTERRAPAETRNMPWACFICNLMAHDCGHREREIQIHLGMPFVRVRARWMA